MRDVQYLLTNEALESGGGLDRLLDKFIISKDTQLSRGTPSHTAATPPAQPTNRRRQSNTQWAASASQRIHDGKMENGRKGEVN